MANRRAGNKLNRKEVALVKAMINRGGFIDQTIQSYFSRPTRTINHARIKDIRDETKHAAVRPASDKELDQFLATWPNVDPETGLAIQGDERLIKAREAMLCAVQNFNSGGLYFRAEVFIVLSVIAWTYLLHYWFNQQGIDFRYKKDGVVQRTREGADRYWELAHCIRHARCPLSPAEKANLEFLLGIRHEIEHRMTDRIDDTIGAKLQACCLNFNQQIKNLFGERYSLDSRLDVALQFASLSTAQTEQLKGRTELPPHVASFVEQFEDRLGDDVVKDSSYRYKVALIPITANRASAADEAVTLVAAGSDEANEAAKIVLKEVNRRRYNATEVVNKMRNLGFGKFSVHHHTQLWKSLNARAPGKNYGTDGDYKGTWVWYDHWVDRVKAHCEENRKKFQ